MSVIALQSLGCIDVRRDGKPRAGVKKERVGDSAVGLRSGLVWCWGLEDVHCKWRHLQWSSVGAPDWKAEKGTKHHNCHERLVHGTKRQV